MKYFRRRNQPLRKKRNHFNLAQTIRFSSIRYQNAVGLCQIEYWARIHRSRSRQHLQHMMSLYQKQVDLIIMRIYLFNFIERLEYPENLSFAYPEDDKSDKKDSNVKNI